MNKRKLRSTHGFALAAIFMAALFPVALPGQDRTVWSTAADIRDGLTGTIVGTVESVDASARSFQLRLDGDSSLVRVSADDVTTIFRAFGDASATDVLRGATGLARLRAGDRVQLRGVGGARRSLAATDVTLLGRALVPTVSGGTTTRSRGSVSVLEGSVVSVNAAENRLVIKTSDRSLHTVRGSASTVVRYRGQTYRLGDLENGDEVRVTLEPGASDDLRVTTIDVLRNISESGTGTYDNRTLTSVYGRVTQVNSRTETIKIALNRGREIRVDLKDARDSAGRDMVFKNIHVGDYVEISGRYDSADLFRADTFRPSTASAVNNSTSATWDGPYDNNDRTSNDNGSYDDTGNDTYRTDRSSSVDDDYGSEYHATVVEGTVDETLSPNNVLLVRPRSGRDSVRVVVDEDMVVRTATGSYITASQIRTGERVSIRAFEAPDGTTIAQTIRIR